MNYYDIHFENHFRLNISKTKGTRFCCHLESVKEKVNNKRKVKSELFFFILFYAFGHKKVSTFNNLERYIGQSKRGNVTCLYQWFQDDHEAATNIAPSVPLSSLYCYILFSSPILMLAWLLHDFCMTFHALLT